MTPLSKLERLAAEVSAVAPIERNPNNRAAYIDWRIVNAIRAELEARGFDWRAVAQDTHRRQRELAKGMAEARAAMQTKNDR